MNTHLETSFLNWPTDYQPSSGGLAADLVVLLFTHGSLSFVFFETLKKERESESGDRTYGGSAEPARLPRC